MQVYSKIKQDSKYSIVFIHGWGGNESSLECLSQAFNDKYSCYRLCLSGFDFQLNREYNIEDYLSEIEKYINENIFNQVILIGHSFGGKLAFYLKLRNQDYIVIALAPSVVSNRFSLKVFLKIKLYKVCKFFHFPIVSFLKGSRDYQNSTGYLRKTFLNVYHKYLTFEELQRIDKGLIIGFKGDKDVDYRVLKRICNRSKIEFKLLEGNHFGYLDSLLNIYRIIYCFLRDNYD